MTLKTFFFSTLLGLMSSAVLGNDSWQEISYQMKLLDTLDRDDGYCVDVVGSGDVVRFDMPLIAHNCKPGLYADEAIVHKKDGTLYFPAYDGCLTVMGLNEHALPHNSLMLKRCNVDEAFLSATKFQKFTFNAENKAQLVSTNLCISVGDISRETFSPDHRWRSLYMQDCERIDDSLSQWQLVKPDH